MSTCPIIAACSCSKLSWPFRLLCCHCTLCRRNSMSRLALKITGRFARMCMEKENGPSYWRTGEDSQKRAGDRKQRCLPLKDSKLLHLISEDLGARGGLV